MKKPYFIDWAITSRCDLHCSHCRGMKGPDLPSVRTLQLAQEMVLLQPRWVIIEGGEPLLHKDLMKVLALFQAHSLPVYLITNGMNLNPVIAGQLHDFKAQVMVSLESVQKEKYEQFRPGASFNRLIESLKLLALVGLLNSLNFTLSRDNQTEIEDLFRFGRSHSAQKITIIGIKGQSAKGNQLKPEEYREVIRKCQLASKEFRLPFYFDEPFFQPVLESLGLKAENSAEPNGIVCLEKQGCIFGEYLFIEPNGDVKPCTFSAHVFRSAANRSLKSIWAEMLGDPFIQAIATLENRKGECARCNYFKKCSGCRSRSYALTGDWCESDPVCPLSKSSALEGER